MPTFSPQQHRQSAITIADSRTSQIPQPHTQLALAIAPALIPIRPTRDSDQPASAQFVQLIRLSYFAHQFAALGGLQAFFESTSCRMCLSNVRSATIPFSLRFSSSNSRSRLSSLTPIPPFLLPAVKGRFADSMFSADLPYLHPCFRLLQQVDDLLLIVSFSRHFLCSYFASVHPKY